MITKSLNIKINLKKLIQDCGTWRTQKELQKKKGEFGDKFINDARNVYKLNDERAAFKLAINNVLGSNIKEVKSHE